MPRTTRAATAVRAALARLRAASGAVRTAFGRLRAALAHVRAAALARFPAGRVRAVLRRVPHGPRTRRTGRVLLVAAVGLAGGYAGLILGGHVVTPVGPTDISLDLRPSWNGGTTVELPPLGALHLDTHGGPLSIRARVADLRPDEARRLIESSVELDKITDQIADQLRHGMVLMLVRATVLALVFAFLAALVVFRSWRRALLGTGSAFAGLLAVTLVVWGTFTPQSVAEPRYTGLLANAPQVVGDARSIVERFSAYRAQLARLVGNVSKLYAATSTLPTYEPDPSTLRVLHVSDIHLNPTAWNVIRSVSAQFQVDLIVDSGDLMDHGSKPEDKFADEIEDLKVPYVYVRGNHDSMGTQKAVGRQKNAVVLDDDTREVAGLRIYGAGDPRYTPDKSTRDDHVGADQLHAAGAQLAQQIRASGTTPDLVVAHDPSEGDAFSGVTPLVLSGHSHRRSTRLLPSGTRIFVQGSTGGAGLRGLEHEEPTPIDLSVLYLSRATHRLQGWDDLRLGGLGLTSAKIERHLEPAPDRTIGPPAPTAPPSPTSPFPSLPASQWPTTSTSPTRTPERP